MTSSLFCLSNQRRGGCDIRPMSISNVWCGVGTDDLRAPGRCTWDTLGMRRQLTESASIGTSFGKVPIYPYVLDFAVF